MAKSFFDEEELKEIAQITIEAPKKIIHDCSHCDLQKVCSFDKLSHYGSGKIPILIIGDSITYNEFHRQQYGGTCFNYLNSIFSEFGIPLRDCWYTHAIHGYSKDECGKITYSGCNLKLHELIKKLNPKVIVTTCDTAWNVLHYHSMVGRAENASYFDWCGEVIPSQDLKTWIVPIYDTKYLIETDKEQKGKYYQYNKYMLTYKKMIEVIPELVNKDFPIYDYSNIEIALTMEQALILLDKVERWDKFFFDYETMSIKPYNKYTKILSVSFSDGNISYAMPFYYTEPFFSKFVSIMKNDAIKGAHNKAFERVWTRVQCGVEPNNLIHDPMNGWHIWHCKKPESLKFIGYALCGILGYDSEADNYIESTKEDKKKYGDNALNRLHLMPLKSLLKYNAIDSLLTYWVHDIIQKKIDNIHMKPGYKLFTEAEPCLSEMFYNGFRIDTETIAIIKPPIEKKIQVAYESIMNDTIIRHQWGFGKFNPSSDADIRKLLYTVLKYEILETTDKGLPSVDIEALETFRDDCTVIPHIIEYKRWYKLLNTFIAQLERETMDGFVNSWFTLNGVATYRSGNHSINIQNQPARDKEIVEILRSLFYPHKGHKLVSVDYKSLEVMGSAAITGDKQLVKYVTDASTDMHKNMATKLFILPPESINKGLRNVAKTCVFAMFYGSFYKLIAKRVWKEIHSTKAVKTFGMDMVEHFKSIGIVTYEEFEAHIQKVENWLWDVEYKEYKEYKQKAYKEFQNKGEIYYPTGFTYKGVSSRNAVGNCVTQGSSFHVNLWAMTRLYEEMKVKNMQSKLIAEIHDSIILSVYPPEEDELMKMVWKWHTQEVRKFYPWFNVPLILEVSKAEVDEPWSKVKEIGVLEYENE